MEELRRAAFQRTFEELGAPDLAFADELSYPDRVGLARYFKFVLFAHDHGVRKPESAFYEAVLAATGCRADELIHVGDSIENDVVAAQALGIRAVWLNRDRKRNIASGAWAEIHSLADLPDVLAR
jgi:putative hydrolase of the HAD superfamily